MIRLLEYSTARPVTKSYAWFVEVNGDKIYTVDEEHWNWAPKNLDKLLPDVSDFDRDVYNFDNDTYGSFRLKDYHGDSDEDYERYRRMLWDYGAEKLAKRSSQITDMIYKDWVRVREFYFTLGVSVYDSSSKNYNALMRFLTSSAGFNEELSISVSTYGHSSFSEDIWDRVPLTDALNSKSFKRV